MHCKTPEYCWDSIITFGTVDTSIMVAIYLSTSHTLSLLHCTNNNAFVVWWTSCVASPPQYTHPTHQKVVISSIHVILLLLRVVGAMDCLIGYVTYPRCCYYLSLEAESYALMTVWKNIPPPLWQKVYTARGLSKLHSTVDYRYPLLTLLFSPPIKLVVPI